MSTDIEPYQPPTNDLATQMDFARAVAQGSLLPQTYRNNPANVLIAVGLGSAMGLTPAESLYRIDVINGKPTASAELIAANVRKAGHKLRVRGDDTTCTATIVRCDDPDFEFTVTRDIAWAKSMQLVGKDNYKRQPGTMLQWRAVTAVARLACPEALYGVAYSADELVDADTRPAQTAPAVSGADRMRNVLGTAEQVDTTTGEVTEHDETTSAAATAPEPISGGQLKALHASMRDLGITDRADRLKYAATVAGRDLDGSNDLTYFEASDVLDALRDDLAKASEQADADAGKDPWAEQSERTA